MGMTEFEKHRLKGEAAPPDIAKLPVRVSRGKAADLLTQFYFETSPRTLERWPLAWRRLNGRAHCETAQLFEVAESRLAEAPVVMGGHKAPQGQHKVTIQHSAPGQRRRNSSASADTPTRRP